MTFNVLRDFFLPSFLFLSFLGLVIYFGRTNVNIITFRDRSMGYGFVTFETEQQASKAVDSMNKKELNGRPVNLEIADENRRGTSRKPRGRRGRGSHRRAGSTHSDNGTASAPSGDVQSDEPSETSLFVGNIPWTMDEEGFSNLFAAFGPAKARIIRRRNGMSKGFGFVEFSSHDAQQRALSEMKEFEVDGRKLSIRVAIGHAIESHSPSSDATVSTAKESPSQN